MRPFKLALAACALSAAAFACGDDTSTNRTSNVAANNSNAPATPPPARAASKPDEFAVARATFATTCQRCHRPDGSGGAAEDDKGKKFSVPSLREGHAFTHTDEQLAGKIANGEDEMPPFKNRLTPEQIGDLVRFIRAEFQGRAPAPSADANANAPAAAH